MPPDDESKSVVVQDVPAQLDELLCHIRAGHEVTILDADGHPIALLTDHPDRPLSQQEDAARRAGTVRVIRQMVKLWAEQGYPVTPDSPLWEFAAEDQGDAA